MKLRMMILILTVFLTPLYAEDVTLTKGVPAELNNLYDNPDYGDVVNGLKAELEKLRKQYGESQKL